jgi:hypothetical protein
MKAIATCMRKTSYSAFYDEVKVTELVPIKSILTPATA